MTWALANSNSTGAVAGSNASTISATFANAVTAGDLIVVGVSGYGASSITVKDSINNTNYSACSANVYSSSNFNYGIFWFVAPTGGSSFSVTATGNTSFYPSIAICEYSFSTGTISTDGQGSNSGNSNPFTGSAISPTSTDLIFMTSAYNNYSIGTATPLSGYNARFGGGPTGGSAVGIQVIDGLNFSSTTTPNVMSSSGTQQWYTVTCAFKTISGSPYTFSDYSLAFSLP